jgi:arabinan endo-1,5-alpha-L-arabinosidase
MQSFRRRVAVCLLPVCFAVNSCRVIRSGALSYSVQALDPLAHYDQSGDTTPVLDPSLIRQGSSYYAFSTDVQGFASNGHLPIHCSQDKVAWTNCGSVFSGGIPAWVIAAIPGIAGLWAPDVSYFNGEYHVYYNGSKLGSQRTVIGLATNVTLDSNDPHYKWIDRGLVLESKPGDDFNALDPSILVDGDGSVWLTYGSYWTGIKQREIDPSTGMLLASNPTRYELATRPTVPHDPIEGASLVHHGEYYYLFVSVDYCCEAKVADDDYKQAVGRSLSPHGPFVDQAGTEMLGGGGTVLLRGDTNWNAPGGGTAYIDGENGESLIVFHAQNLNQHATPYQWVKALHWVNDWPAIEDLPETVDSGS